ncbi:Gfo/Idh/MocA family oxidoreductase [Salinibaculum salinum]|uniref:Gfo/Idh/MocA family oxidoreductase n=1 Tax=Salinibaculum salinum TaxID=3131996 RepID=UPI0030EF4103
MTELTAGVIGTGTMGGHHARVYAEHQAVDLVGVHDADHDRAVSVAEEYGTAALPLEALLAKADIVSIAVPTEYHYDVASQVIEAGVHLLIEKPLTEQPSRGEALVEQAQEKGVVLQVGHIERFNPAVQCIADIIPDLDVIAIDAHRLGPPIDRAISDSAVLDLMIHDLDVVCSLVDGDVTEVAATGTEDGEYATATVSFEGDVVGQFTASRVTQQKVRELSITAKECRVNVDYADQTVHLHRRSVPEYVEKDGDVRFRHESLVERPTVDNGEPLKREIDAFVEAVREGTDPVVSGRDGLRALSLARQIDDLASGRDKQTVVSPSKH